MGILIARPVEGELVESVVRAALEEIHAVGVAVEQHGPAPEVSIGRGAGDRDVRDRIVPELVVGRAGNVSGLVD